jgi:hypothetical protein
MFEWYFTSFNGYIKVATIRMRKLIFCKIVDAKEGDIVSENTYIYIYPFHIDLENKILHFIESFTRRFIS